MCFRNCIRFFRVGLEVILQWGDRSRWAGEQSLIGCRCTDNWEISGIQLPLRTVMHKSVFQILEIASWSPKNARTNVESREGPEQERLNLFEPNEGHFFIGSGAIGICPAGKSQQACNISSSQNNIWSARVTLDCVRVSSPLMPLKQL